MRRNCSGMVAWVQLWSSLLISKAHIQSVSAPSPAHALMRQVRLHGYKNTTDGRHGSSLSPIPVAADRHGLQGDNVAAALSDLRKVALKLSKDWNHLQHHKK